MSVRSCDTISSSDSGDSGSQQACGGAYCGVWGSLSLAKVWSQAVGLRWFGRNLTSVAIKVSHI